MMEPRGQRGQQALLGGIAEMLGGVFVRWRPILRRVFFRIEAVGGVQYAHRKLGIILLDQHADLDLRRGDRLDVDAAFAQRLEHRSGDTGVAAQDRKSTRLNSSHYCATRIPSSACKKKNKR